MRDKDILDLVKRLQDTEARVARLERLENILSTVYADPAIALSTTMGVIMALPALRGFWPGSAQYLTGAASYGVGDASGNGLHGIAFGNPVHKDGGSPRFYVYYGTDGTDGYDLGSATNVQITGTEGSVGGPENGLTIGSWVYFNNTPSAAETVLGRWLLDVGRAYLVYRNSSGVIYGAISNDGTNTKSVNSGSDTITTAGWHFVAMTYDPSTSLKVFKDGTWYTNTTSIYSSIYNPQAVPAMIGSSGNATNPIYQADAWFSMTFLCAANCQDGQIERIYNVSRNMLGI